MKDKIRADLGDSIKVYCLNSVEKRMRTGETIQQFGKEIVIKDLIDLLWENISKRIASNYAAQMRSGLFSIIDGIKEEYFDSIDSAMWISLTSISKAWHRRLDKLVAMEAEANQDGTKKH